MDSAALPPARPWFPQACGSSGQVETPSDSVRTWKAPSASPGSRGACTDPPAFPVRASFPAGLSGVLGDVPPVPAAATQSHEPQLCKAPPWLLGIRVIPAVVGVPGGGLRADLTKPFVTHGLGATAIPPIFRGHPPRGCAVRGQRGGTRGQGSATDALRLPDLASEPASLQRMRAGGGSTPESPQLRLQQTLETLEEERPGTFPAAPMGGTHVRR